MATDVPAAAIHCTSDLVWDGGLHGTAFVDNAAPLLAGADVGWTPDLLAATAVGAELMTLVLRQASEAGLEIAAYVSEQRLTASNGRQAAIVLAPSVSVVSRPAAEILVRIMAAAIDTVVHGRTGRDVIVEPRVIVSPSGCRA